jgi:hypothetical protein
MLMFLREIQDNRPLACLTQQVDPNKIMEFIPIKPSATTGSAINTNGEKQRWDTMAKPSHLDDARGHFTEFSGHWICPPAPGTRSCVRVHLPPEGR